ncbi:response regulator transcription factor [Sphingobacterium thalpophilum]|uniref:response regulator transcription factor n=1 Tax=Sphingobacterium thalpophilum TaxID=259 RepID=UPI003DA3F5D9
MAPIVYLNTGQLAETVFINGGFLVLSGFLLYRSITIGLAEQRQLENLRQVAVDFEVVRHNCVREMLSPRETEVATMLCQRLTAREIADKLFISDRTVDKHRENIYFKVGVHSRDQLLEKLNKVW